jgi:putative DNA primase/helicase
MSALADFRNAMQQRGLVPPSEILADGKLHRCDVQGKNGSGDGAYIFHDDDRPAGGFQNWQDGQDWQSWTYTNGRGPLTAEERSAMAVKFEAAKRAAALEAEQRHQEAAERAAEIWAAAIPAETHAYLDRKKIRPHGTKIHNGALLIPIRNEKGKLRSLQFINADGSKRYLSGGEIRGGYFSIGKPSDVLCIGEGFATMATVYEATSHACAIAFDCGNLDSVAKALRAKFPDAKLIICADDDHRTTGNPGLAKATAAAHAVDGVVAKPLFVADRGDGDTDFNDLALLGGIDAVRASIEEASNESKSIAWAKPESLPSDTERFPYPMEALPDLLRQAVEEVQLFVQSPVEMVAASALSALSIAAQPLIDVRRTSGLQGPTSLFFLTIAESGERKSTLDRFFTQPIYEYERQEREAAIGVEADHAATMAVWEAKRQAAGAKLDGAAKGGKPLETCQAELSDLERGKPTPPRVPRIIYADATQEKLLRCLATAWPSAAIVSSEGGAVFGAHAMGRDSVMRTLGSLNVLWDGGILPVDRVGGGSFTVRGARLSINLQVQPSVLCDFMESNRGLARGSGFLARFLLAAPETRQGTRMFQEAPPSWPALDAFNARIAALLATRANINDDGSLSPVVLDLSHEAKAAWVEYHDQIEKQIGPMGDLADVRDVAAKAADNIARMAALFHLLDEKNAYGTIGPDAVRSAALVVIWHLYQSKRFLGAFAASPEAARATALDSWLRDYCRREGVTSISTRTVQQFGPIRIRKVLDEAMAMLAEDGRAKMVVEGKKRLIAVNPALLEAPR